MIFDYYERFGLRWKLVKGNFKRPMKICPRCNNKVEYLLHWDNADTLFALGTFEVIKLNKFYAFKCPICPNFDLLNKDSKLNVKEAKNIIKGRA